MGVVTDDPEDICSLDTPHIICRDIAEARADAYGFTDTWLQSTETSRDADYQLEIKKNIDPIAFF